MKRTDKFIQGYVCAIVVHIKGHGIDSTIAETFRAGVGSRTIEQLEESGVDEYDLECLKQHWKELSPPK